MRNIDATLTAELAKEAFAHFFLVRHGFSTEQRFTDWDIPVYYDSEKYSPRAFTFGDIVTAAGMSVDRVTIDYDNVDRVVSTALLSEDCRNKEINVYVACNITSENNQVVEELFRGLLDSWTIIGDRTVAIEIANELILWNKKTLRNHAATCPWAFKGTECGYSGEESWCDQSYERCLALSNDAQFGGFRFLPAVAEKEIWWGRQPK